MNDQNEQPVFDENALKSVMTSMASTFDQEERRRIHEHPLYKQTYEKAGLLGIDQHEQFYYTHGRDIGLAMIHGVADQFSLNHHRAYAWCHSEWFEAAISSVCEGLYGSPCCADRGRWVFRQWFGLGENHTCAWPAEHERSYYQPASGSRAVWMALMDSLVQFRLYGKQGAYLLCLNDIYSQHGEWLDREKKGRVVYAIGFENRPGEFGMIHGPTPKISEMLDFVPDKLQENDPKDLYILRLGHPDIPPVKEYCWDAANGLWARPAHDE